MFNMIIVDDEQFILDSLSPVLSEIHTGFNLTASFTNPIKALNYIQENPVHLVITDVKMPQMSGIDFAKEITENYPEIKIIILTAYSEIEYAQQAIKYNTEAYLLKPIDTSELYEALDRISKSLILSTSDYDYITESESTRDYDHQSACKILINAYKDNSRISNLYSELKSCGMNITSNSPCAYIKLYLEDLEIYLHTAWEYGLLRLYNAVNNCYIYEKLYIIPISYSFDTIDLFIIQKDVNMPDNTNFLATVSEFTNTTISNCTEILNLTVRLDIVNMSDSIEKFSFNIKNSPITDAADVFKSIMEHTPYTFPVYCEKNFDDTYQFGKFLVFNFSEHCNDFVNIISPMLEELSSTTSIRELNNILDKTTAKISNYFNAPKTYNKEITQACIDYINKHYNENISLSKIANEMNISSSQLSKIFKKTVNMKYVDYLNTLRLEKAKALLADAHYTINTIASLVGYTSYQYFLRIFKSYTGMTPQEYRSENNR